MILYVLLSYKFISLKKGSQTPTSNYLSPTYSGTKRKWFSTSLWQSLPEQGSLLLFLWVLDLTAWPEEWKGCFCCQRRKQGMSPLGTMLSNKRLGSTQNQIILKMKMYWFLIALRYYPFHTNYHLLLALCNLEVS